MDVVVENPGLQAKGCGALQDAAAALRHALLHGDVEQIDDGDLARIMTCAMKVYAAKVDERCRNGTPILADELTPTDVVVTVTDILHAAGMNLWDLSMWLQRPRSADAR
jgi:hypothetical protein